MDKQRGRQRIEMIRGRWISFRIMAIELQSATVALIGYFLWGMPGLWAGLAYMLLFGAYFLRKLPTKAEVTIWLNQEFPELEDSTGILLKQEADWNLLEQLQAAKITPRLELLKLPLSFYKSVWYTILFGIIGIILCVVIQIRRGNDIVSTAPTFPTTLTEKVIPGIQKVNITIVPPAYTGLATRSQASFHITTEDSSEVRWEIHTHAVPGSIILQFSDSTQLRMIPDSSGTTWHVAKRITHTGFYQVKMDSILSGFYQLQLIPDQPPLIKVSSPAPNTTIDFGRPPLVNIHAQLSDDYGLKSAAIVATIASGSGEAVKFKEQQFAFDQGLPDHPKLLNASKTLNLANLGMKPRDELYFHIAVTDTRQQQTLSDVYIVTLPDTAALFSLDGMVNAVNIKPEYFRSQRQIILETEALIHDKDSLGTTRFNSKSNELGTDQKLLRLRYGKFLGEESESNVGDPRVEDHDHDHGDHDHQTENGADFGNAAKILDEFTDKHDNAEDATFFDPEIKKQLKATLTEMWKAELQLRLYKPQEALPYEYKALRLLKDLQQKSRAFVPKTGTKTTPLKPEKRLTGEQDKISPAVMKQIRDYNDPDAVIRAGIAVLDGHVSPEQLTNNNNATVLRQSLARLTTAASREPGKYLNAMAALQRIVQGQFKHTDPVLAQQGLWKLLSPAVMPQPAQQQPGLLQDYYFRNIKKTANP
ncbi:hypothetical protein CLV59_104258 [Chitinophaga dinghuensis]|uniref:DUF4175 family protein n=1 Tax=Chitinophaga dinghuensis TaxID=1539050 RepID=A0A327W077_9BACT|nr:DUF4175 family protein [Chitinophaga dinghuensis]RAJ82033.1 hypothetical protein CLV59_104258 [Chitinophaga dinghuensis]